MQTHFWPKLMHVKCTYEGYQKYRFLSASVVPSTCSSAFQSQRMQTGAGGADVATGGAWRHVRFHARYLEPCKAIMSRVLKSQFFHSNARVDSH